MSNRRTRHLDRMPIEEKIRLAATELVGQNGIVHVERSGEDSTDSVLVQISLGDTVPAHTATTIQARLRALCQAYFPENQQPSCCAVVEQLGQRHFLLP